MLVIPHNKQVPTPYESEINALLRDKLTPRQVAEELVQRWRRRILSEAEQTDCAQFLLASGFYPLLFEQILNCTIDRLRLPWAQFVEGLGRTIVKPDELEWRAIVEGAETQDGAIEDLFKSPYLDILDSHDRSLIARREKLRKDQRQELEDKKTALKEKLLFMRSNRLFDQEKQVLEEIQALFPEEPEFAAERESFQIRWAHEIIAKAKPDSDPAGSSTNLHSDLHWKLEKLSPEQLATKNLIVERAKELVKKNQHVAYDLAIGLHAMDLNFEALEILELGEKKSSSDWLKLELMILARQFVDALDHAGHLEVSYADDPDAAFAVIYARARALYGLGQVPMAVDLLRSLVRIRPHYKSAQSLLMDWSGGDAS